MRKLLISLTAAALMFTVVPAAGADDDPSVVDVVVSVSGDPGTFDRDRNDYDLLREAVLVTGLAPALSAGGLTDISVFAPNDKAFWFLARDLGYRGGYDEASILDFLVSGLAAYGGGDPIPVLTNVLLYHVVPDALSSSQVRSTDVFSTVLGVNFTGDGRELVDKEPDLRNPRLTKPGDIQTLNGYIHTIDRVLVPVSDLVGKPAFDGSIVDLVVAVSGGPGTFDSNRHDYDLLREAVLAADLAGALSAAGTFTVFAPNDKAFELLARDLGYQGGYDEAAILGFIVAGLDAYSGGDPIGVLTSVLLYHVAGETLANDEVRARDSIETLLGASFHVGRTGLIDAEPGLKNAKLKYPEDVYTDNGVIQTIDRVLIPVGDLVN